MIHLFAITYADQLRDSEKSIQRIVELSATFNSFLEKPTKG